jgi:hypothetical protein
LLECEMQQDLFSKKGATRIDGETKYRLGVSH